MSDSSEKKPSKSLAKIKSSLFERSLSVAKIGLNAGFKYAAKKATGNLSGEKYDQFMISQAKYITTELGQLKGSLMKAGQMLSMYGEYFFPPEANQFLKMLQTNSPPLDYTAIHECLQKYLSEELLSELEIDKNCLGSASMGQVHLAVVKSTGEKIALKIQYPDVDLAIDSDIKALKTLLNVSKILPTGLDLDPVMNEVKQMLHQELDYVTELNFTKKYYTQLHADPEFASKYVVPKVFERYSNKKILATEYIDGYKADHPLVQSLSQKRRDQLAVNFLDLYQREIFQWNLVQTDPHLGNYKIQIDALGKDRIVLLDFGATSEFNDNFISSYRRMIQGSVTGNVEILHKACRELGFIQDGDKPEYIKAFTDFCFETVEPFWLPDDTRNTLKKVDSNGFYHWKDTDLPGRVVKKAVQFKNFDLRAPPKEILFLDRKTGGVFIFLSVLGANINARKVIDPYFKYI
jgi:predicted unusual protein kinase regulating ubiquinone biosynthesis (AarF/ABC1/UbiB family)